MAFREPAQVSQKRWDDSDLREIEVGVLYEEGAPLYDTVRTIGTGLEHDSTGARVSYTFNNTAARPAATWPGAALAPRELK